MTEFDRDAFANAYDDVRNDSSETNWAVFRYDTNSIVVDKTGSEYEEFMENFKDEDRLFAFLRVFSGDELSKRAKFVFITWCGCDVSPLKRAKLSVDKNRVQGVIQSFAVDLQVNERSQLLEDSIKAQVVKAGGANYGTGQRD